MILKEFNLLRGEEYLAMDDSPVLIKMDRIEVAYPCTDGTSDELLCTRITTYSGENFSLRIGYNEFIEIWNTCIEPLTLNL